ncbi:hypothetical protein Tco_1058784 [Tanacetum coccineum]|uniref:Uncharacterized protein n=1 Tax=Tanacetum coccineum TaxID=301880 RepID=A0ABQ5HB32_9ASTR
MPFFPRYMTPSSVADSSMRRSEKMHGAMTVSEITNDLMEVLEHLTYQGLNEVKNNNCNTEIAIIIIGVHYYTFANTFLLLHIRTCDDNKGASIDWYSGDNKSHQKQHDYEFWGEIYALCSNRDNGIISLKL